MRAHRIGYRPVICPEARIVHEVGQSSATPAHKMLLLYRGKACFFHTHYSGVSLRLALLFLTAGVGFRVLLSRLRPRAAKGASASDWPAAWRARREWLPGYPVQK
jgi:GT2 family glycosyltransferase